MLFSVYSYGGIFGPSNYEECVTDIVKSAKNSDLTVAKNVCRNQFPKLINLSKKKNVNLACEDILGKWVYEISIVNGKVSVKQLGKVLFDTTSFTKESITFKGSSFEKNTERRVNIYGKINSIAADGNITVEYPDKKIEDFIYEFTCSEVN